MRYATRGEVHNMMGSGTIANEIQTERNRKRPRDGYVPETPTSTLLRV